MSFFNLTHMGYENTIAESLEQKTTGAAEGSHVKYTALKTKHTRSDKGPIDLHRNPVSTSQDYGWWQKDSKNPPEWAKCARHAHVNSEMTRFVDDMSKTNKDFKLF
ncbi:hypothetical protein ACHWQZ_G012673 [Mnemiopsis leidyi]